MQSIKPYFDLIRFTKPIGSYLLLWPCLSALFLANNGVPPAKLLVIFILGTVIMRSAGCAINDYADRDIDAKVARTATRPLAQGALQPSQALKALLVFVLVAMGLALALPAATWPFCGLALGAAILYPFTKRWLSYPQIFLGIAYAMAIPIAFVASHARLSLVAALLFLATVIWALVYDTFYAMADRAEDQLAQIKSIAILLGDKDRLFTAIMQLLVLVLHLIIAQLQELHFSFYGFWLVALLFAGYQQYLIAGRQKAKCFGAFMNSNYFGLILFGGIAFGVMLA